MDFGKELPKDKGTVAASREIIAEKIMMAEAKGDVDKMRDLRMQQERRDKRTYMFDCLLKQLLLLIDAVLNDRESYAYGEKARFMVLLEEQKSRFNKEVAIVEQKAQEKAAEFDKVLAKKDAQINNLIAGKEKMKNMVTEYEQKLKEALSVEKRVKDYETVHARINELSNMLEQVNFEREK